MHGKEFPIPPLMSARLRQRLALLCGRLGNGKENEEVFMQGSSRRGGAKDPAVNLIGSGLSYSTDKLTGRTGL